MTPFESLRAKHLEAIRARMPSHVERLSWSREQVEAFQQKHLRALLAHCVARSSLYQQRVAGIDPSNATVADLQRIEPLTKSQVMESWDQIVTVEGLTRDIAEAHIESLRDGSATNPYWRDAYQFYATGGSSGQRGMFIWDWDFFIEGACTTFRWMAREDERTPPASPDVIACIAACDDIARCVHASTPLFSINIDPKAEVHTLRADQPFAKLAARLAEIQPTTLIGFSSLIASIAEHCLAGQLDIHPRRVSTNSEPLDAEAREMVREAWGIGVNNEWGSVEVHVIGTEDNHFQGMILAEDMAIIESVDADLKPCPPVEAQKLLVTALFNRSLPLIRYVLDDAVVIVDPLPSSPGYRVVQEVRGRSDDWFLYERDRRVHPMTFRGALGQHREIFEYQVRQTEHGADVSVVSDSPVPTADLARQLVLALDDAGLPDAQVTVEQVREIPRHAETHKLRRFVRLPS